MSRAKKTAGRRRWKERERFKAAVALMKDPELIFRPPFAPDMLIAIDRAAIKLPELAPRIPCPVFRDIDAEARFAWKWHGIIWPKLPITTFTVGL